MNIEEMSSDCGVDNGPLAVRFNPGNLSELATVSSAAALMHHRILNMRQARGKLFGVYTVDLNGISLPANIKSTISQLVECGMTDARTQWWAYHHECVFLKSLAADTMIDWLDQLVWLPEGTINYRQTAKKLLNCGKLTNVQKLQLACSYCFVEDVESLKETLTNAEINHTLGGYGDSKDLISRYWYKKLLLGPRFYLYADDLAFLLNNAIDSLKHYDEWSAVEYFFNKLNNEDRVRKVNDFIDLDKPKITWHLLLLLTGSELDSVIGEKSRQIMITMVKERWCSEYAVLIWKRMVHLIDNDALADIIIHLNDSKYDRDFLNPLLWEMWLGTLERQKKYIVDEKICDFIEDFDANENNLFHTPNFQLIIDLLSRSGPERRYEYLTSHYPYLVIGQLHNRKSIDRIMKLCFENDQQIDTFKNTIMVNHDSISEYCEYLIIHGLIEEVSNYVDFCTTDQQVNRDVKKMIIMKMPEEDLLNFLFHHSGAKSVKHFHRYLDEIFTEHESKEFLNRIITRPGNLKILRGKLTYWFQEVVKFVEKYVSSEEDLFKVKHDFFQNYRTEEDFSDSVFFDLTVWCFNGDHVVAKKFKKLSPRVRKVSDVEMTPESGNSVFELFVESFSTEFENN